MYKKGKTACALPRKPYRVSVHVPKFERARVLFSYDAENDDELNLEEGTVINVLDKHLEDSGWWKGEVNGKIGVFPDNFVTILPPEERPRKPPPPTVPQEAKRNRPVSQASVDKIKKEEVKEDKKVAGRRPAQVPQTKKNEKLPVKTEQKLVAQTDDMKAQEQTLDDSDKFVGTETSDQKLTHPTAVRVRAPIRRPPGAKKEDDEVFDSDEEKMLYQKTTPAWIQQQENPHQTPHHQQQPHHRPPPPQPQTPPQAGLSRRPVPQPPDAGDPSTDKPIPASKVTPPPTSQSPQRSDVPDSSVPGRPLPPRSAPSTPTPPPARQAVPRARDEDDEEGYMSGGAQEDKRTPPVRAARPPPPTPKDETPKDETPKSPILRSKSPVLRPTSPAENQKDCQPPAKLVDAAVVDALRKELQYLQANTVSREDYVAVQADLRHIREDMDKMRTIFNKKLLELMKEVDEEKKIRLNMQVEMDRVKKLVVGEDNM